MTNPLLFTPITIRGVTVRNRVMVSPMCQYASVDGGPTDWHLVNLGRYTLGGAGDRVCEGGIWDIEDAVALARALKERGVDMVDCSSGGITGSSSMPIVPRMPGYQVHYTERVRREADIRTIAVGLLTEPEQAEAVLAEGRADLIAMVRATSTTTP